MLIEERKENINSDHLFSETGSWSQLIFVLLILWYQFYVFAFQVEEKRQRFGCYYLFENLDNDANTFEAQKINKADVVYDLPQTLPQPSSQQRGKSIFFCIFFVWMRFFH